MLVLETGTSRHAVPTCPSPRVTLANKPSYDDEVNKPHKRARSEREEGGKEGESGRKE